MNHTIRSIFTLLLLCITATFSTAQNTLNFSSDQGLSNTCIRFLFQDSRNNIWIGTRNGLNRYDGAKINVYHHISAQPYSIGHDLMSCAVEFDREHIIMGHEAGVQSYNYDTNTFTNIPLVNENNDTIAGHVVSMANLLDGTTFVHISGGGCFIIKKNKDGSLEGHSTKAFDSEKGTAASMILPEKKDKVWILNMKKHIVLHDKGKETAMPNTQAFNRLCLGPDGDVYATCETEGFYKYNASVRQFVKIDMGEFEGNTVIKQLRFDGKDNMMICTDGNGLLIYNTRTNTFSRSSIKTAEYNLAVSNIEDAIYDSYGNLWVGVYWKGVVVQPHSASIFEYVGRRSAAKNTLGTNCITSIMPGKDGWAWVATDHCGLYYLSSDGTSSLHYKPGEHPNIPSTINALCDADENGIWLGSFQSGLFYMSTITGTVSPFSIPANDGEYISKIYDMKKDMYGNLWIATLGNGIFRYASATHKLEHFHELKNFTVVYPYNIIRNKWVYTIKFHKDKLIIGNADGIEVFAIGKDGSVKTCGNYLGHMTVNDIEIAKDGTIWAATSEGLQKISSDWKNVTRITNEDGVPTSIARSVELYYEGDILKEVWSGTDNGLVRYNCSTKTMSVFYFADGLQGNEFTDGASARIGDRLLFGGINGLNYFNPSDVDHIEKQQDLECRIIDFYLAGVPVYAGQKSGAYTIMDSWVAEAKEIHLAHDDNTFSLELATMSFYLQHTVYEYSVNGEEWISLGVGQNRISFTNMSPGTYKISVRATVHGNTSEVKTICVIVHPAWYASPLAYFIYLLLFLTLAYFIYRHWKERLEKRRMIRKHKQEEEINEARIQFFMNISHEIRTPMTLILAPLEKLKSLGDDDVHQRNYNLIHQNAQRILRLINQLMDIRKIEKGQFKLEYSTIDLVSCTNNLHELFATTATARNITFDFNHEGIDRLDICADSQSIDKILMNLLSNAFKFTAENGKIVIDLKKNDENKSFTLSVADNGVGIADSDKEKVFQRFYSAKHQNGYIGTGIGLNLTYLLINMHKGEISVHDNPEGKGTVFTFTMPIGNVKETKAEPIAEDTKEPEETEKPLALAEGYTKTIVQSSKYKGASHHRNLILVEDDADIRQYIHAELSRDFVIQEFPNGLEAWEYIQKFPQKVDLVISDVMMPVMEGTELCKNIKSNFNTDHIPVILLTAKDSDTDRIEGMSLGANAYMTKPFNVELLRTTAISILASQLRLQGKLLSAHKQEQDIDKVEIESADEHLLNRVNKCINDNISNPELSVEFVADKVGISRVHFHRKMKELSGQTPRDYIKNIRLQQAARLLREKKLDITDVSIAVGFRSLSAFSTSFKSVFGMSPTEYMHEKNE